MSDSDNDTDSKRPTRTLRARTGGASETGRVKQSFSHGRSKSVVVEKRRSKKLTTVRDDAGTAAPAETAKAAAKPATRKPAAGKAGASAKGGAKGRSAAKGGLSDEEQTRREKALEAAKKAAAAAKAAKEAAERKKVEDAAAAEQAEAAAAAKAAEDAAAAKAAEEAAAEQAAREAEEAAAKAAADAEAAKEADKPKKAAAKKADEPEPVAEQPAAPAKAAPEPEAPKKPAPRKRADDGVKTGADVDISALTTALPGPKIISRAPPKPKAEPAAPDPASMPAEPGAQARSRPRPGADSPSNLRPGGAGPRGPTKAEREAGGKKAPVDNRRRSGKLTIQQATGDQSGGRRHSVASMRRRQEREKRKQMSSGPAAKVYRDVKIPDTITVQELANRMTERAGEVVKTLMKMDMMVTINQPIDADTAQLVVEEFGHTPVRVSEADVEVGLDIVEDDDDEARTPRAPVVTIMGHVDHGKTSLLDKMRNANVVSGEAGGITQHIGAYQVKTDKGVVTFLDTPGHAAFTSMRARGAQVTDIVILVVAADDSVMPQTIEAIAHSKAAGVPMIVAINKMDRPAADANRVRTELLQHDVQVEGMGGDVLDVEVSAMTGDGLDKLLEAILLQAELLDLKAKKDRSADGVVVEAQLDVGRGPVATVLVQRGTLKVGDIFVAGEQWGKVRALVDDHGKRTKEAGPSVPVEVLGLNGTPEAGDTLVVVENEKRAEEVAEYRQRLAKEKRAAQGTGRTLDQMLAQAKADADTAELPIVIKADVQGSAEAIIQAVEKIGNDEVRIRVLHSGVGAITESDVTLAEASGASIIGFNVRANSAARNAANQKGAEIRYYSIIYNLLDDLKAAATGLLSPEIRETFIGYAKILQVFRISGTGNVAGCQVTEGVARREAGVRLLRDDVVIHEGKLKTLKRFKDEVKEVQVGQECGMAFERYEDMRENDVIEIFETQEIERTLA